MSYRIVLVLAFWPALFFGQTTATPSPAPDPATTGNPNPPEHKRIFGIIPNYRTSPTLASFKPLTPRQKFKIASQDALDRGTIILAAAFAGEAQLTKQEPTFGQGAAGYFRYFGASYGDYFIGDYMTEGIFPTLLHQDPRYFRRGKGGAWSRLGYSMGQIFITHGDNAKTEINFSELGGNAVGVAISEAYYPSSRDAGDAISKWGQQIAVDMASNVLKEFFPDIARKFSRKHQ